MNKKSELVSQCALCQKEISLASALTVHDALNQWYFCGLACYEKWIQAKEMQE